MQVVEMVRRMITCLKTNTEMMIVFLVIVLLDVCQCAVTVTPPEEFVMQGNSITIIATTDEDTVTWTYKSGSSLSLCSISGSTCFIPQVDNMFLSADASTNTSKITINAVNCSINDAVYTATTSSGLVASAEIVVTTPASSIDITTSLSTQKVSTQVLSFNIPCVDPQPVANYTITRQGKPSVTIVGVTKGSDNSGCQCTESTYTIRNTITASDYPNEVVSVTANVGQLSPVLIGTVNFTGSSEEKSSNVGTIVGAVIGGVAGAGATGGLVVVGSKLVKKQASVKNSEEDKSNKNSNEDKSKKNSKKRKSKNKKDQTNADDAKDGRSAAAPDSAGVKADQNSAKEKQNVEFINEERSNMLKNKGSSNVEQKGTHTDDMEHKGTNSNNETKTDTTDEAAVTEEKTIFLSMNTA